MARSTAQDARTKGRDTGGQRLARVAILGAGFAGHTAALYLGSRLGKGHEVTHKLRCRIGWQFIPE